MNNVQKEFLKELLSCLYILIMSIVLAYGALNHNCWLIGAGVGLFFVVCISTFLSLGD